MLLHCRSVSGWHGEQPQPQALHTRPGHHQPVVGAVLDGWVHAGDAKLARHSCQPLPHRRVGRDTTCHHQAGGHLTAVLRAVVLEPAQRAPGALLQEGHHGALEGGGDVGSHALKRALALRLRLAARPLGRTPIRPDGRRSCCRRLVCQCLGPHLRGRQPQQCALVVHQLGHAGLEPAEREVARRLVHAVLHGQRELELGRVAASRQPLQVRAARDGVHAQQARHLVKALARAVVQRGAQDAVAADALAQHQHVVAA
mmetsp:Transcript_22926/g.58528  ORF Transcript_22926/g.58528 Transcript_22926/m.58528 type:complete len:257 (-) Transcript_22926:1821-2591(-)